MLKNDVLFYVRWNAEHAGHDLVVQKCELAFDDTVISDAKDYLIKEVFITLEKINRSMANDVRKCRGKSNNRSKASAECMDIYQVLDTLGCTVKVIANDIGNISKFNPEFLVDESILQRIIALEEDKKAMQKPLEDDKKVCSKR